MKKLTYDDILFRLGFFRNQANLSARETSFRLGYSEQYIKRIENKDVDLKMKTLLEFCDVVAITIYDFFYLGKDYNAEDKNVLELYSSLSAENKQIVLQLMKKLS